MVSGGARAVARCDALGVAPYSDMAHGLYRGYLTKAYAAAHAGDNIQLAAESDFGADMIWQMSSKVAETGLPLIAEIATTLAPLGVAPSRNNGAGGGPDVGALGTQGVGILDLEQDGMRYFDIHHTPDDTLDKVRRNELSQNVAAWAAAVWLAASDDRVLRTK